MADFDEIYEEEDDDDNYAEESFTVSVPDPVVVRGAGNVTMYIYIFVCLSRKSNIVVVKISLVRVD